MILYHLKKLPEFDGKLTEKENLHLTLKFLGEISRQDIEELKKKLSALEFNSFEAEMSELGTFSETYLRIIWAGITGCDNFQKAVDDCVGDMFAKENRFMSHVTIARVKSIKDRTKFKAEIKKIKLEKKKFLVDRFYFIQSTLSEKGPQYKILEEYILKNIN